VCVQLETASLDCRLRLASNLEEERLQQLQQDAQQQQQQLQRLLEQQEEDVRDELLQQAVAAAAAATAAAQLPSAQSAAQGGAAVGASRLANATPGAAAGQKPVQLQTATLAAQQQQLQQVPATGRAPAAWLHAVSNPAGQLQVCYSQVKGVLAKQWPVQQQQRLPGLLLVQLHPADASTAAASAGVATSNSSSAASRSRPTTAEAAASAATTVAAAASAVLDDDVYSQSHTVLRLKSITASSSMLQLLRGKHLLQLQCSPLLLHSVSFHATADFTLEEASKLLPAACGLHVISQEGQAEALQPGSRQLLFRYFLKPSEACSASFELRTSSAALASCSKLMLVCNSTRQVVRHVLNQPEQVQLDDTDKGYVLLCLAEPHVEVPAGAWSVSITSSRPLPALQDLGCARQVQFEGMYAANTKAVVAR
jgi:hypothetical protein